MNTGQDRTIQATKVTWTGIFVNIALVIIKLAAGVIGKSGAIIADAVHSITDFASDAIIILGVRMAAKPADKGHDYGHGKVETLAAVTVGSILILVGAGILLKGSINVIKGLRGEALHAPGMIALYAAFLSIVSKEWLYHHTIRVGKRIESRAVIANAWHHRSDAFSSIGTMAGIGGAIFLGERWRVLDPLAAAIVSLLIIRVGWSIYKESLNELLEASESDEKESRILEVIKSVPGVNNPHGLRTRRIGYRTAIDVHVEVNESLTVAEAHRVAENIESRLRKTFGAGTMISIHIEPLNYMRTPGS